MENNINKVGESFTEHKKDNGGVVSLSPDYHNTIQPVALMCFGLFMPALKSTGCGRTSSIVTYAITDGLLQLSLARSEGYENMKIIIARLDLDKDFNLWVKIRDTIPPLKSFRELLNLPFIRVVPLCGICTSFFFARIIKRIEVSMPRIAKNTISFISGSRRYYITQMVQSAKYDPRLDVITLHAKPNIVELYRLEHKMLFQLRAINAQLRKKLEQVLYTFIECQPSHPSLVCIGCLRIRLNLTSWKITLNITVRKAMGYSRTFYLCKEIRNET